MENKGTEIVEEVIFALNKKEEKESEI